MRWAAVCVLLLACGDDDRVGTDAAVDASSVDAPSIDAPGVDAPGVDAPGVDAPGSDAGPGVTSTLTISCDGELQGRSIVNFNTNLGIAFTDPELPFTSRGSISFDFPSGFSGTVENPELVDDGPRHTLAITDRAFTTYGNHCWTFGTEPQPGSATIDEWRPTEGIVRATFVDFPVRNCVSMSDTCVINGAIETSGEGTFE